MAFLGALRNQSGMSGAELGQVIVDSYISEDERIVDDQARADFIGRGSPLDSLFGAPSVPSAEQVTRQLIQNVTLTVADLGALPS